MRVSEGVVTPKALVRSGNAMNKKYSPMSLRLVYLGFLRAAMPKGMAWIVVIYWIIFYSVLPAHPHYGAKPC